MATTPVAFRDMLKSKIHRATVTQSDLHYVGSITIDAALMEAADLLPGEKVDVVDIDNGNRFSTYVITGDRDSGVIGVNGAAARLVAPGDLVIVISYSAVAEEMARSFQPRVVFVDAGNRIDAVGADPAGAPAGSGLVRGDRVVARSAESGPAPRT
ncbi:aspartate 1-decarboxylase [Streptomyces sp. ISL-12]|uniref:aspartate 1-decarboxylase n=1 Tax=Streptomyces sp. ISL-12 TaxID=2819177 RepID=UPI00203602E4|nr:aspartate 1-decarboxylase [Streptomyces sp. ISL-12]